MPLAWLIGAPCAAWPVRSAHRYTGPWTARTPHPILVIGARLDPNTPLSSARLAAKQLGNAVLLTHDGYGHISSADPSTCVQRAIANYLITLATPSRGTVCRSNRLRFDPKFGQTPTT